MVIQLIVAQNVATKFLQYRHHSVQHQFIRRALAQKRVIVSIGMRAGVVAFSFGLRAARYEPNPSNAALAEATANACDFIDMFDSMPVVVSQWEISKGLQALGMHYHKSVELNADGSYLDSRGVWEAAKREFEQHGIKQVVIIAQPFLHLPVLRKMVEADGYELIDFDPGKIPFDGSKKNTQPWTRSRIALLMYAIKAKLGFKRGHAGRQHANT